MKKIYLFLMFLCGVTNIHAQGEFLLTREPDESYAHGDSKTSALVVQCNDFSTPLYLTSPGVGAYEATYVIPDEKNKNNVMYIYEITMPGSRWEQEVSFIIDGYKTLKALVTFTKGKQAAVFTISDPNKATSGYYYHRRESRSYLEKGDYALAMAELKTAEQTCNNVNKEELSLLMGEITKIQGLYAAAQDSAAVKNYFAAGKIYGQILDLNKNDKRADTLMADMEQKYKDYTGMLYREADGYLLQRKYTEATEYFQNYLKFHGANQEMAISRLNEIKREVQNKRVMPHVFYYQFDSHAPIGFGYGRFNDRKVGWFMNFSMNSEVLNLVQQTWEPKDGKSQPINVAESSTDVNGNKNYNLVPPADVIKNTKNVPEINLAIVGLSIPLVSPHPEKDNQYFKLGKLVIPKFPALYLNIVPLSASLAFGYNETILYRTDDNDVNAKPVKLTTQDQINEFYDDDKRKSGYSYDSECKTTALFNYAPQVGLTLKWGRLALFYTYEYRYLVNERTRYKDGIRANRNMFGLGIAW